MPLTASSTVYLQQQQQHQHRLSGSLRYAEAAGCTRHTSACLTYSRGWLKDVARHTVTIGRQGFYVNTKGERVEIEHALRAAVHGSVHYHSSHVFTPPTRPGPFDTTTQMALCYGSALQVASVLQKDGKAHVGILNSSSAKSPDKFFRGTISPEECACRATLLYPCLNQFEGRPHYFYYINNKPKYKDNSSSCAIFSPHVPVIRQDNVRGQLLDRYETVSFVSIPAANAFKVGGRTGGDRDDSNDGIRQKGGTIPKAQTIGSALAGIPHEHITLEEAMVDRIFRALCIFQQHGVTDLVLCAFGCGVHGNDPTTVARIFREVLNSQLPGHFRRVVFCIPTSRPSNYHAMASVFPEAVKCQDTLELGDCM